MSQRPQIPADMKDFNRKLIAEFRNNGGQLSGQMVGARLMLLTTSQKIPVVIFEVIQ